MSGKLLSNHNDLLRFGLAVNEVRQPLKEAIPPGGVFNLRGKPQPHNSIVFSDDRVLKRMARSFGNLVTKLHVTKVKQFFSESVSKIPI